MKKNIVLALHGIGTPPNYIPDAERPYWISTDRFNNVISGLATVSERLGIDVLLTFDDGNRSDLDVAAPRLLQQKIKALFFPCVGRFSHRDYLSPVDLRRLAAEGFEVGSHGIDHVAWTGLHTGALRREIADSKAAIEDVLGTNVQSAAIPFGAYNRRVLAELRTAGYTTVYSSDRGFAYPGAWFRRRWTYRIDEPFEIAGMAAISASLRHQLITSAKGLVKSIR